MKSSMTLVAVAACCLTGCSLLLDPGEGPEKGKTDAGDSADSGDCVADTDQVFCENKVCGVVTATDNCGKSRTVACQGSCFGAQICEASGATFECRCSSPPHVPTENATWAPISKSKPIPDDVYDYTSLPGQVIDKQTCLYWKRYPLGNEQTQAWTRTDFEGAQDACGQLDGGWRVPTLAELDSIVDHYKDQYESHPSSPTINTSAFPHTPSGSDSWFWTSTIYSGLPYSAVEAVDFEHGRRAFANVTNTNILVRCVR